MIPIVYEDGEIWVVSKPPGLASQGGVGVGTNLVDELERQLGARPLPVHRLDRGTAGLVVMAKSRRAAARWTALVSSRAVGKRYLAVVFGSPPRDGGIIDAPVGARGKELPAETAWLVEERIATPSGGFALVEAALRTGRTHQIRVHLAGIGCPIVGDDEHGDFARNRGARDAFGAKGLMLLARNLELPDGRELVAPMPPAMESFVAALRAAGASS